MLITKTQIAFTFECEQVCLSILYWISNWMILNMKSFTLQCSCLSNLHECRGTSSDPPNWGKSIGDLQWIKSWRSLLWLKIAIIGKAECNHFNQSNRLSPSNPFNRGYRLSHVTLSIRALDWGTWLSRLRL